MTTVLDRNVAVKVIGASGQISLGKEYAGKQVLIEEKEPGVWLVRTAVIIPENEMWLHGPQGSRDLQDAMEWAQQNPARESHLDDLVKKATHGNRRKR
ncbi:hypothetical protein [Cupriavidus necator]